MIRRRIAILFLPALLAGLLAAGFSWLLNTEQGAGWLLRRVAAVAPGTLTFDDLSGNLQSGIRIGKIAYRNEGLFVQANAVAARIDLDFWPPAVSIHYLNTAQLSLNTSVATEPAGRASPADWLPALSLPLPLEFRRVSAERVAWYADSVEPRLDLRALSLSADWYRSLVLDGLEFTAGSSHWRADAKLGFRAPYALALDVDGRLEVADEAGSVTPIGLRLGASGDLSSSRWEARVEEPAALLSGELRDILETPAWDLQLAADRLPWPLSSSEPDLLLRGVSASSYGTAADYGIEVDAAVSGTQFAEIQARLVGAGDRSGLELETVELAGDDLQLDGSGRCSWQDGPAAAATLDVLRFSPRPWMAAWGDAAPFSGRVALAWGGEQIRFELLNLAAPGTLEALRGSGTLDPGGNVAADLEWRQFAWPPGTAAPAVVSREGRLALEGRMEDWVLKGVLDLSGPDFPSGRLEVEGKGDESSLHFNIPRGEVLGGSVAAELDVAWAPAVEWAASARVENLSTGPLDARFPGRVSGELAISGRPEQDALEIRIRGLSGVVRQRQVGARGNLVLESGRTRARDLRLRSGRSSIRLDGGLDTPEGLAFEAGIDSLADFLDGASGSFTGRGLVSLDAVQPTLRLEGEGRNLSWPGGVIGYLKASPGTIGRNAIHIEMNAIDFAGGQIESFAAVTSGDVPLDRLEAWAEFAGSRIELRLDGRVRDWATVLDSGWSGQLQTLRLDAANQEFIELEQPAGLSITPTAFALESACFSGYREGRLCLEGTWRPQGAREIRASLQDGSPNLALTLLGSDLIFTQRLAGVVEWRQEPRAQPVARVDLQISAGEISERGDDRPIIRTGAGRFGFNVADGRLYSGNLDIPLPGSGGIDTDFSVPDLSAGLDSPVKGRLRFDLNDIGPLMQLVPGVEGSSGPVTADMSFSGSLADPKLTGHASLVRGTLSHFASGLVLEDIRLAGAVYQYDQTELTGTFRAGEGQGAIRSVLNFDEILNPELLVQIEGENLTLVNVPDLNVTANPDVRLVWRQDIFNIDGRVTVPTARLSPRYLPTSATAESADVVIVAGHDPLQQPEESKPREWRLRGGLELELGSDVQLLLDRARTQVSGRTKFSWEGAPVPVADGGFSLTGEIYAYGQLLKVTEGRVNFSNRPADNPFLNVRAEREIYGNSQVTRAGVLVTGTLKEPILEPYSVPMTTRERALTLLVTGSDFNYEQGVGTVEVGMYIAPKLFISYGIGLFEDQSVISARYDLGKGFGIKTTSGQRESGADITYTIER